MTHLKHAGETLEDYCVARIASRRHADWKPDPAESGKPHQRKERPRHDHAESHGYAPWSNQETLTKKAFDVSGAVDDPENLNTIGERAVEDEVALEALHRPGADGREARIPKAPLRAQFRHVC